jgi:hypothetical protein
MKPELFQPTAEAEGRLLLLIDGFTGRSRGLEGRTKLAKLDFFLRYPAFFRRALTIRAPEFTWPSGAESDASIENRMIRFRYGPWDPAYFAILGRLIGKGLIQTVPAARGGLMFRTTQTGEAVAKSLRAEDAWVATHQLVLLLKSDFDLNGSSLKDFIYAHFPEVSDATWGERI